jgi:pimeloyl-ACP methyl ester carboxylesterase
MNQGSASVDLGLAVRTAVGPLAAAGPAEHDWRHEVHRPRPMKGEARSGDGIPLRFEARGSGAPALVLVHGWSCDRSYWDVQLDWFSAGHQVVGLAAGPPTPNPSAGTASAP